LQFYANNGAMEQAGCLETLDFRLQTRWHSR